MPLPLIIVGGAMLAAAPMRATAAVPLAPPAASRHVAPPAHQRFTWRWTDGSRATERTFAEARYQTAAAIPKFEVKVHPASPPWTARLLFWVNGEWVPRQTERSDPRGRMRCVFLPIGPEGDWEDVTWIVRIRMRPVLPRRSLSLPSSPRVKVRELLLTIHYVSRGPGPVKRFGTLR